MLGENARLRRGPSRGVESPRVVADPSAATGWYVALAILSASLLSALMVRGCRQAASEARAAAESFRRCRLMVRRIRSRMEARPLLANPAPRDFEYGATIRRAAEGAGILESSFPSPSLGPEIPIGETGYVKQVVETGLGPVTMPQLVTFLHRLATADPPFQIGELELTPAKRPAGVLDGEWWQPRLTLTYSTVSADRGR